MYFCFCLLSCVVTAYDLPGLSKGCSFLLENVLKLNSEDVFADLGCGVGRLCLQVFLDSQASAVKGVFLTREIFFKDILVSFDFFVILVWSGFRQIRHVYTM